MPAVVTGHWRDPPRWRVLDLSYPSTEQNLALEEALARTTRSPHFQPTIRVWINQAPSAIIGRFQDVNSEVNLDACTQHNVQVIRRFTGGGTVFHDDGNLNLTVVNRRPQHLNIHDLHNNNSSIILDTLQEIGLIGTLTPTNSIQVAGKKISGAAAALGSHFVLWHASILVSTNTAIINKILSTKKPPHRQESERTHFTPSNRQPVTTIQDASGKPIQIQTIKTQLISSAEKLFKTTIEDGQLTEEEDAQTSTLRNVKYSNPRWNLLGLAQS